MKATAKQIAALESGRPVPLTEAEFQRLVLELARARGWRSLHIRPARTARGWRTPLQGDGVGWPDTFLVRGKRVQVLELKTEDGQVTPEQEAWLLALNTAGIPAACFRPSDWHEIEELLK